jgi:hypothetical protein
MLTGCRDGVPATKATLTITCAVIQCIVILHVQKTWESVLNFACDVSQSQSCIFSAVAPKRDERGEGSNRMFYTSLLGNICFAQIVQPLVHSSSTHGDTLRQWWMLAEVGLAKKFTASKEMQIITIIISKSLQTYLETIPGQHSIHSLQKTAILGTSHIITMTVETLVQAPDGSFPYDPIN